MITERDSEVIKFIEQFKTAHTSTIAELFYPSLQVAQRRLKILHRDKVIKRERYYVSDEYFYYIKKPKQIRHKLILTDFYREIKMIGLDIQFFQNEMNLGDIIPDGILAFKYKDKNYIACVEVEISNKGFDISKYKRFFKSEEYKKYFPVFPLIIAITNQSIHDVQEFKVIKIKENLSDIENILK